MTTESSKKTLKIAAVLALLPKACVLFVGCGSDKLADQSEKQIIAVAESVQSSFAEEGWTYTGCEVLDKNEENDTVTVRMSYDVVGDAKKLLEEKYIGGMRKWVL